MSELQALCDAKRVKIVSTYGAVKVPEGDNWMPGTHPYKCTLRYKGRRLTVPFFMGPANTREPTSADVLSCLISDATRAEDSFEDFCSNLGYDNDSRKAEATFKACAAMGPKIRKLLGDDFDAFSRAEH